LQADGVHADARECKYIRANAHERQYVKREGTIPVFRVRRVDSLCHE